MEKTMFNDKPLINSGPLGFANNLHGNHVGQFNQFGDFTPIGSSLPTARADAFGNLRDNISGNVVGRVQGAMPRPLLRNDFRDDWLK